MITFERTRDLDTVQRILTDPRCYVRMANDAAPAREDFRVLPGDYTPVLAREDGEPVAVFLLCDGGAPGIAEVHFCFVPDTWGRTQEIARAFVAWIWRETSLYLLLGPVPSYNRLALELAYAAGFERRGLKAYAGVKHGRLFDLILTELRRPDVAA